MASHIIITLIVWRGLAVVVVVVSGVFADLVLALMTRHGGIDIDRREDGREIGSEDF